MLPSSGPLCFLCMSRGLWSFVSFAPSPFPFGFLLPQSRDGQSFFIRVYRTKY